MRVTRLGERQNSLMSSSRARSSLLSMRPRLGRGYVLRDIRLHVENGLDIFRTDFFSETCVCRTVSTLSARRLTVAAPCEVSLLTAIHTRGARAVGQAWCGHSVLVLFSDCAYQPLWNIHDSV